MVRRPRLKDQYARARESGVEQCLLALAISRCDQRAWNRTMRPKVIPNSGRNFWIIGQRRMTKEIGGSVLIYVLTLPFLKPRKDPLRLVKVSPAGMEPAGAAR